LYACLHKIIVGDQSKPIVFERQVALFVAKEIRRSGFGGVNARKIVEIKTELQQLFSIHFDFIVRVEVVQNTVIITENPVHFPHHFIVSSVYLIVPRITAGVVTKLFVRPTDEFCSAFQTSSLHNG
jgi:hypothetical protein